MSEEKLQKGDTCPECKGSCSITVFVGNGQFSDADCHVCGGTGMINIPNACPECKGSGKDISDTTIVNWTKPCLKCKGTGIKPEKT